MKEYIKLSVDAEAYYSGNTYYEEVFLPKDVWEEIKNNFRLFVYLCEFDGKHSEVKADIDVDEYTENQLTFYKPQQSNDGENLFEHIYEYLDEEKYDSSYLMKIQDEVESLCEVETMTLKFNKKNKDEIMELLKEYIL